jgi:hypothetical protein
VRARSLYFYAVSKGTAARVKVENASLFLSSACLVVKLEGEVEAEGRQKWPSVEWGAREGSPDGPGCGSG